MVRRLVTASLRRSREELTYATLEMGIDVLTRPMPPPALTTQPHWSHDKDGFGLERVYLPRGAASGEHRIELLASPNLDTAERRVFVGTEEVRLTKTEFELLRRLAERPGQVFERERLLSDIWGYSHAAATRTVDSHIRALRRKLGSDLIRTVFGVGYALVRP